MRKYLWAVMKENFYASVLYTHGNVIKYMQMLFFSRKWNITHVQNSIWTAARGGLDKLWDGEWQFLEHKYSY